MTDEERQQFEYMKERVAYYDQLFLQIFGDKPEAVGQIVALHKTTGSVSVGGTIRVVTTLGEFNFLIQ